MSSYFDTQPITNLNESFTYLFHPIYGNCYTFNSLKYENNTLKEPVMTTKTGSLRGLSMNLNFNMEPGAYDFNQIFQKETYYGGVLFVHEFGSLHITEDPIYLPAFYVTNIQLQRKYSDQLPKPYSGCIK